MFVQAHYNTTGGYAPLVMSIYLIDKYNGGPYPLVILYALLPTGEPRNATDLQMLLGAWTGRPHLA